mmetsp:Transcript_1815/g.4651  ORF Transcript_1815/g.4651 Transcript_1815/m.4651 type:complete len:207 (-) Transcript_1815:257-877(-)
MACAHKASAHHAGTRRPRPHQRRLSTYRRDARAYGRPLVPCRHVGPIELRCERMAAVHRIPRGAHDCLGRPLHHHLRHGWLATVARDAPREDPRNDQRAPEPLPRASGGCATAARADDLRRGMEAYPAGDRSCHGVQGFLRAPCRRGSDLAQLRGTRGAPRHLWWGQAAGSQHPISQPARRRERGRSGRKQRYRRRTRKRRRPNRG